jgi:hypothetical protein
MKHGWFYEILRDFEGAIALAMIVARHRVSGLFPRHEREIHLTAKTLRDALAGVLWIAQNWRLVLALLLLVTLALLSGCATSQGVRPWVQPQYELEEVTIRWIRTSDQDWKDYAHATGLAADGMAIPDPSRRSCIILANPPERDSDAAMQILGHEVAHCFMGLWHGPWFCGDVDDVELARSLSAESSDALLAALRQIMPCHADQLD